MTYVPGGSLQTREGRRSLAAYRAVESLQAIPLLIAGRNLNFAAGIIDGAIQAFMDSEESRENE